MSQKVAKAWPTMDGLHELIPLAHVGEALSLLGRRRSTGHSFGVLSVLSLGFDVLFSTNGCSVW